jgi:very-short-patch-repair endonuclease
MPSEPEEHFALLWQAAGGIESGLALVPEFRFHPTRKWRADFALPTKAVLIEIEGGVHSGGRHTRGTGFSNDAEKYLEATLAGWRIIRLIPSQLTFLTAERILSWISKLPNCIMNQPPPPKTAPSGGGSKDSSKPGKKPSRKKSLAT